MQTLKKRIKRKNWEPPSSPPQSFQPKGNHCLPFSVLQGEKMYAHILIFFTKMNHIIHVLLHAFLLDLILFPYLRMWLPHSVCSYTQFFREYHHCTRSLAWTRVWALFPRVTHQRRQAASKQSSQRGGEERAIQSPWFTWGPPGNFLRHYDFYPMAFRISWRVCWAKAPLPTDRADSLYLFPSGCKGPRDTAGALPPHSDPPGGHHSPLPACTECPWHERTACRRGQKQALQTGHGTAGKMARWPCPPLYYTATGNAWPTEDDTHRCLPRGTQGLGRVAEWGPKVATECTAQNINNKTFSYLCTRWPQSFWTWWRI